MLEVTRRAARRFVLRFATLALVALAAEPQSANGATAEADYYTLPPCRIYDTRTPVHDPLTGGPDPRRDIQVSGVCGVPAEADAVAVNLTVVDASRAGALVVYDADLASAPASYSTLEVPAGRARANNVIVELSAAGQIAAELSAGFAAPEDTVDLIVDVLGYFAEPGIRLVKSTNGEDANSPPGPSISTGSPVSWQYQVTNTGEVVLTNVTVTDDRGVAVFCPKTTLQPGESMTCTGNGVAQACQYSNVGTVTAKTPGGLTVSDDDPSHYFGTTQAGISITKRTNGQDANTPPGPQVEVGSNVSWTYVVTNTGDVTLTGVAVTDDQGVTVACPKTSLAAGESMTCSASGTAVAGQYSNVGTVTGTAPCGSLVTDDDPSHYLGVQGSITLKKSTNGQDADTPPGPQIQVGNPVQWSYVVLNNGATPLSNLKVTDDQGVAVTCPKTTLQSGESMTCTGNGVAQACQYSNVGTVTGKTPGGLTVSDDDPSHYFGGPCP